MFGSLLTIGVLLMLFLPGLLIAHKKQSLSLKLLVKCFLVNVSFYALLGLLFQALPWLVDPRFKL